MQGDKSHRIDPSGQSMVDFVNRICTEVGPRIGGSEEEKKAGNIIYDEFSTFCDEVERTEFTCRPGGFLDFIWVTTALYLAGFIAYFYFNPLLSVILIITGLAVYVIQQNFLYEVVDFLFSKISSFHVTGKLKPNQTPKKLVLLAGHHDSAYEFPLLGKLGGKSAYIIITAVLGCVFNILLGLIKTYFVFTGSASPVSDPFLVLSDIQNVSTIYDLVDDLQLITFVIGTGIVLTLALFLRSNKVVMGANDNLTAVAAVIEIGKYLSKPENQPKETEVWLVSFAGEEHMRGSKRFVSRHFDELKKREALLLNLETLSAESFLLATGENMFLAKHSPVVVEKVQQAFEKVQEVIGPLDFEVKSLKFAGSDAANFSRKGLHAATIFGLTKEGTPPNWHTLEDTPDKLSGTDIAKVTEIALQFVYEVDGS
ncbi:MAG: M28 family metallopeptidase [Candidatus Odinarchaeota archaeon]